MAQQLAAAVLGSASLEVFGEVPLKELRADALTELNLSGKHLGPTEGVVLAGLIKVTAVMTSLNLNVNGIKDQGAAAIGEALKVNAVLTELNLANNGIVSETGYVKASEVEGESKEVGAKVIYQGREMTVSKGVDRDGELRMKDFAGVVAIAEALKVNAVMKNLDLSQNR